MSKRTLQTATEIVGQIYIVSWALLNETFCSGSILSDGANAPEKAKYHIEVSSCRRTINFATQYTETCVKREKGVRKRIAAARDGPIKVFGAKALASGPASSPNAILTCHFCFSPTPPQTHHHPPTHQRRLQSASQPDLSQLPVAYPIGLTSFRIICTEQRRR